MGKTHVERNAAGLAQLQSLAARLSEDDLRRQLDSEWTIAVVLAHLAFWDHFVLARWELAARRGLRVPPGVDGAVQDLVNAAALASVALLCSRRGTAPGAGRGSPTSHSGRHCPRERRQHSHATLQAVLVHADNAEQGTGVWKALGVRSYKCSHPVQTYSGSSSTYGKTRVPRSSLS
jgi:hypothetical protein